MGHSSFFFSRLRRGNDHGALMDLFQDAVSAHLHEFDGQVGSAQFSILQNGLVDVHTAHVRVKTQELGYDAMIAAVAGLQRLKWTDRISEIIEPDRVLYAIGQGALGIECRHNDMDTIQMLSVLNHEPSVIRCVAERAFLRRIGGGCSIPNAVRTEYNDKALVMDGILLNLDGSRLVKDHLENADLTIPMTTTKHGPTFFVPHTDDDLLSIDDDLQSSEGASNRTGLKRKRTESEVDSLALPPPPPASHPSTTAAAAVATTTTTTNEAVPLLRHYAHVCGVNINETILENAELCGSNLAVKLMQMGADSILEEIHQSSVVIPTP